MLHYVEVLLLKELVIEQALCKAEISLVYPSGMADLLDLCICIFALSF